MSTCANVVGHNPTKYCGASAQFACYWCYAFMCTEHAAFRKNRLVCLQCASDIDQTDVASEAYKNHQQESE